MDGVITWLITMKPLWFLAAWLASSVFGAFVALEKNRYGLCWFAMGVLFGPLALITTAGLPVKPPRPMALPKVDTPDAAHAHTNAHAPLGHAGASAAAAHHAPVHPAQATAAGHPAHATHAPTAPHPQAPHSPHAPALHPAVAHALQAAVHPPAAHHAAPVHPPAKPGFFASAMERPAAGIAVAAVVVVLLLLYFGSLHL